ncbi:hypothetical protein A1O1_09259 [Capronia coronata CBS 617.96]|uniref:NCS1 family nucleobase:cation symporter-1 n=1 Tax=Capronia coronata CBS 617.96 TaxID=1182541 RepID=W9XEH1_9EURO|nr:uncharacterized protein A1O1_09259 [Capronia coronata CBS 617.96]EXJ78857.1 hypothetical protein A1O1_09259 [Capronia coronata CBS 617.96]
MANRKVSRALHDFKTDVRAKATSRKAWELPRESTSFAPPGTWTNIDYDVTPLERRTWGHWSLIGYWMSDILSAQSWEGASTVIAGGLTYREALLCLIMGTFIVSLPMCLNGSIGAKLHVPFPVAARSSFGYLFSKAPVVIRMITALFWHAIQTYAGSTAMTQVIRSIWPSYLHMANHLPASAGITSQQLLSHFIFWTVQFPFLLTPPHKLRWFFVFKAVFVIAAAVGTVIGVCTRAGGSGDIWDQKPLYHGSERSWLILSYMTSLTGGWATMATNIPDLTRYLKKPRGIWLQAVLVPGICTFIGVLGILATSASKVLYGSYLWDPLELISHWHGAGGRAAAFFVGLAWVVAQIGVNVSANVVSCSNDLTSLCPRYINLRRAAVIVTIVGGWVMVPWKIVTSANSLVNFMGALSIFLAPIAAILVADFWIVKRQHVDVPALYRPHARYRYVKGCNWRAAVALIISLGPNMPGLVNAVNPHINIGGAAKIYDFNYLWGFFSAFAIYTLSSLVFPAMETLIPETIHDDAVVFEGKDDGDSATRGDDGIGRETVGADKQEVV